MYRIIQKRNYLFALSLALLVPGMIGWWLWGLRLGIDFTGGTVMTVVIPSAPTPEEVKTALSATAFGNAVIERADKDEYLLRLPQLSNEQHASLNATLTSAFTDATELAFETVGPTIGRELKQRAVVAVVTVLVAIILYITWAFRKVSSGPVPSWVYGLSAFVALLHDVFMVVGVFAILGHVFKLEVNSLFVTALLTVLGFSVHDTIVVFDRIRERLRLSAARTFEDVVNESLNQTLVRSLNTSITTLLVLVALFIFGGSSIRFFVLALIIGITLGTYSSIFVASPLLVVYERLRSRP